MPNPVPAVETGSRPAPEPQRTQFTAEGRTFQKAAFYIHKTSWGEVSWSGEQAVDGVIYKFPRNLNSTIYKSLTFSGSGRFARAQNLASLQRSVVGSESGDNIGQAACRLINEINSENASEYSLKVGAKLIGMQLQLAGIPLWQRASGNNYKVKERIEENGCCESSGNNPFLATLLGGISGRPVKLEKSVKFLEACQRYAQQSLAEQIRTFGETHTFTSAEDLVHRAKLTLVAAPTEYLRQRPGLAIKICEKISSLELLSHYCFHNGASPPRQREMYSHMAQDSQFFQTHCNSLRNMLISFGNPIP